MARTPAKSPRKSVRQINFRYDVSVDYDHVKAHDHETRCANDYCRCSTIQNTRITSIDVGQMAKTIMDNYGSKDPIKLYCVERIIAGIDKDSFDIGTERGYYGEELGDITISDSNIITAIESLMDNESDNNNENVRFALVQEYGYLLDELKKCTFRIVEIDVNDLLFGQGEHYRKLKRNVVEEYMIKIGTNGKVLESNIYGVVIKKDDKYRIIDGYHRCRAAEENPELHKIKVLLAEMEK